MNALVPNTEAEKALGFTLPTRRDEEWKWTDLRRLVDKPYAVPADNSVDAKLIDRLTKSSPLSALHLHRILVVNGVLQSAPAGMSVSNSAPAFDIDDPLIHLNGKLQAKTIHITFAGNIDQPVEILNISSGEEAAFASRLHVTVADGASATLVETFVGEGDYLSNPVTTVELGKSSRLDRIKIETESPRAQHLSHCVVSLASDAQFNDFTLTAGALLSRQNGDLQFYGENAKAQVCGSYLLKDKQHADTRLVVDHKVPHCVSRELFKCVMQDKARGIFQGKVIVRPDAQKTDGKQSSHALLLSETAEFDAKPELEIYADDVVCGHGTTCGDLNHDHLFYLKSRGIPEKQARAMLVHAFVGEAIETIENEAIRDALDNLTTRLMTEG